jgi:hypothetical protein
VLAVQPLHWRSEKGRAQLLPTLHSLKLHWQCHALLVHLTDVSGVTLQFRND